MTNTKPFFSNDQVTFYLDETASLGTVVAKLTATLTIDVGEDNDGPLVYSIIDGNENGAFAIDSTNGEITVANTDAIDADVQQMINGELRYLTRYEFTVRVSDGYEGDTITVIVEIDNENDNLPVFDQASYAATVAEDLAPGSEIVTVSHSDADYNPEDLHSYSITGGNEDGLFVINERSGAITLADGQSLDRETAASYTLTVQVSDEGRIGNLDTTEVTITVDDVNEFAPVFAEDTVGFMVAENAANGTVVGTVSATDDDATAELTYRIIGGNDNGIFEINSDTGAISVADSVKLDFETFQNVALEVEASDGVNTDTITVSITLTDENDNAPVFGQASYDATVAEDIASGTAIITVSATDVDEGGLTYRISSNPDDLFTINAETGEISLAEGKALDRESAEGHVISVEVSDGIHTISADVTITVTDVNDNLPEFTDNTVEFSVFENAVAGTVVGQVVATDLDAEADLTYVISGYSHNAFVIDSKTGVITIGEANDLDFERRDNAVLIIQVSDGDNVDDIMVNIALLNENDNDPVFAEASYSATVAENIIPGTNIAKVQATDADGGGLSYRIISNSDDLFTIDPVSGQIVLADGKALDRETAETHTITVEAFDGTKTVTTEVIITVTDVNEFAPVFTDEMANFELSEDAAVETVIGTVTATDADTDAAAVSYLISGGNDDGLFAIDANGQITLADNQRLDRETADTYILTVQATDGERTSSIKVTITVTDVNDNLPEFADDTVEFSVFENAAVQTVIGTVTATDLDVDAVLAYAITAGNDDGIFAINSNTGEITLLNSDAIDYETLQQYTLTVEVSEGTNTDTIEVLINVLNVVDETPPVFDETSYEATVAEDLSSGITIITVTATDADGNILTYRITSNPDDMFAIDADTGEISLADGKALDRETAETHTLTVEVSDAINTASIDVTITVTDINEHAPVFPTDPIIFQVSEDATDGTAIGTVIATDADATASLTYSIILGNDDARFSIDSDTGVISLADASGLDYETVKQYALRVEVSDGTTTKAYGVTINVGNVNDNAPVFEQTSYTAMVAENINAGNAITSVRATDADGNTLTYRITSNPDDVFAIDADTGAISIATGKALDRATAQTHTITVEASDGINTASTQVVFTVTEAQDLFFSEDTPDEAGVLEHKDGSSSAISIATVTAIDTNGDDISYTLDTAAIALGFAIDSKGIITYSGTGFNYEDEAPTSYTLTVTATSNSDSTNTETIKTATHNLVVKVVDVNERFDPDIHHSDMVTLKYYQFDVHYIGHESGFHEIIDGERVIERDTSTWLQGTGRMILDGDLPSVNKRFTLGQGNDIYLVYADVTNGAVITDTSGQESIVFVSGVRVKSVETLPGPLHGVGGVTRYLQVKIDGGDGTRERFFNIISPYSKRFYFQDDPASTAGLTAVELKAIIDGVPVFSYNNGVPVITGSRGNVAVAEDSVLGKIIRDIDAVSADTDGEITYSIINGNAEGLFAIDAATGVITLVAELDYEFDNRYTLTIQASDGKASSTYQLVIAVRDVNDNPPVFDQSTYYVDVAEDQRIGSVIDSIIATDIDVTARLTYRITEGNELGLFEIADNGVLKLSGVLDYETTESYTITVEVSDGIHTATTQVVIQVTDANEYDPVPSQTSYTATVAEDIVSGTVITTISATDDDATAELTYDITSGNQDGLFAIDSVSGIITLAEGKSLDRETTASHVLTVSIIDGTRTVTVDVTVTVSDVDEPPVFAEETVNLNIAEDAGTGTVVGIVSAAADMDALANLTYQITEGNDDNLFAIANDGTITLQGALDFETTDSYTLTVQVAEGALTATTVVIININDANDHSPEFTTDAVRFSMFENVATGTVVGQVVATDLDVTADLVYSIVNGSDIFSIDEKTGVITVIDPASLDYEETPTFELVIQVSDGDNTDTIVVNIALLNKNDNDPVFAEASYSATVAEDIIPGTNIAKVQATDADGGGLSYRITSNSDDLFAINPVSGQIVLADGKALDRETAETHTITVEAFDGTKTVTTEVIITVTDVNEFAPVFTDEMVTFDLSEDAAVGTVIGTVTATDADGDPVLAYAFTAGNDDGIFAINSNTGEITLLNPESIDYETLQQYTLTVEVSEGTNSDTIDVTIAVTDANDAPVITPVGTGSVAENAAGADTGITFTVADPDAGETVTWSIAGTGSDKFEVVSAGSDGYKLKLRDEVSLDYEAAMSYSLTVTATDTGGLADSTDITVTVQNDDDGLAVITITGGEGQDLDALDIGDVLTASVLTPDPDGIPDDAAAGTWRWFHKHNPDTDIGTGSTYTIAETDRGANIGVEYVYTDAVDAVDGSMSKAVYVLTSIVPRVEVPTSNPDQDNEIILGDTDNDPNTPDVGSEVDAGDGNDKITGGGGNDEITGGKGDDQIDLGGDDADSDVVIYSIGGQSAKDGGDVITNFNRGVDQFVFSLAESTDTLAIDSYDDFLDHITKETATLDDDEFMVQLEISTDTEGNAQIDGLLFHFAGSSIYSGGRVSLPLMKIAFADPIDMDGITEILTDDEGNTIATSDVLNSYLFVTDLDYLDDFMGGSDSIGYEII